MRLATKQTRQNHGLILVPANEARGSWKTPDFGESMLFRIQYGDKPTREIRADAGLKDPKDNLHKSAEMAWDLYKGMTGARRRVDDEPPTIELVEEPTDSKPSETKDVA